MSARENIGFDCWRDRHAFPTIDQGVVHGLPATWNPDDGRFYIHAAGTTDGTNVLGRFKHWRNAVYFAKLKAAKLGADVAQPRFGDQK